LLRGLEGGKSEGGCRKSNLSSGSLVGQDEGEGIFTKVALATISTHIVGVGKEEYKRLKNFLTRILGKMNEGAWFGPSARAAGMRGVQAMRKTWGDR